MYSVNDYVMAWYRDSYCVALVIKKFQDTQHKDGISTTIQKYKLQVVGHKRTKMLAAESQLRPYLPPVLQVGQKCYAVYPNDGKFYKAVIERITDHATVHVSFLGYKTDYRHEVPIQHVQYLSKRIGSTNNASSSKQANSSEQPKRYIEKVEFTQRDVKQSQKRSRYAKHLSMEEVEEGLKSGKFVRGQLRINPYFRQEAYVTTTGLSTPLPHDVFIDGELLRNRALDSDEVVIRIHNPALWKERKNQSGSKDAQKEKESATSALLDSSPSTSDVSDHDQDDAEALDEILDAYNNDDTDNNDNGDFNDDGEDDDDHDDDEDDDYEDDEYTNDNSNNSILPSPPQTTHPPDPTHRASSSSSSSLMPASADVNSLTAMLREVSLDPASNAAASEDANTLKRVRMDQQDPRATTLPSLNVATQIASVSVSERKQASDTKNKENKKEDPKSKKGAQKRRQSAAAKDFINVNELLTVKYDANGNVINPYVNAAGNELQMTGEVVAIYQENHLKEHVGFLQSSHDDKKIKASDRFVRFLPIDKKMPRMIVRTTECPSHFLRNPELYSKELYLVRLCRWSEQATIPMAKFVRVIGQAGDVEVEMNAILAENNITQTCEFPARVLKSLQFLDKETGASSQQWTIPKKEVRERLDLRNRRIFTIDPVTAKDVDDALSITPLRNGVYEIGVHIADVSYFVQPNTPLDIEARNRATTVYLMHRAIPMLPPILSEELCSLNPGVDRLAFSVFFKMNENGELLNETPWYGRTIIRSCVKLDYEIAQKVIDGEITTEADFPEKFRPVTNHKTQDVINDILMLYKVSSQKRKTRFETGAMQLQRAKLKFLFDESGLPVAVDVYKTREANHMVEEYMLMTNFLVARKLIFHCKDFALLRNHAQPVQRKLDEFIKFCSERGYDLLKDVPPMTPDMETPFATAGQFYNALRSADPRPEVAASLEFLATRTLQNANYLCAGDCDAKDWRHYALNIPYYTHFTSPIRRYADLVVHRLLDWAITQDSGNADAVASVSTYGKKLPQATKSGNLKAGKKYPTSEPTMALSAIDNTPVEPRPDFITRDLLARICKNCNEKRSRAKKAQEHSDRLYLCLYLNSHIMVEEGIIAGINDKAIVVMVPRYGLESRIYLGDIPKTKLASYSFDKKNTQVTLTWSSGTAHRKNKQKGRKTKADNAADNSTDSNGASTSASASDSSAAAAAAASSDDSTMSTKQYSVFDRVMVVVRTNNERVPMDYQCDLLSPFDEEQMLRQLQQQEVTQKERLLLLREQKQQQQSETTAESTTAIPSITVVNATSAVPLQSSTAEHSSSSSETTEKQRKHQFQQRKPRQARNDKKWRTEGDTQRPSRRQRKLLHQQQQQQQRATNSTAAAAAANVVVNVPRRDASSRPSNRPTAIISDPFIGREVTMDNSTNVATTANSIPANAMDTMIFGLDAVAAEDLATRFGENGDVSNRRHRFRRGKAKAAKSASSDAEHVVPL